MALEKTYTTAEAAQILGVSAATLKTWRSRPAPGTSDLHTKLGGRVVYRESQLKKYLERGTGK